MAKNKGQASSIEDLIKDLMIIQLGLAGLSQHAIREIVGVDIHKVNKIVKHFNQRK
jgi:transposase-like protein